MATMIEMKTCRGCGKVWKQNQDDDWRHADWTLGFYCRPCLGKLSLKIWGFVLAGFGILAILALAVRFGLVS